MDTNLNIPIVFYKKLDSELEPIQKSILRYFNSKNICTSIEFSALIRDFDHHNFICLDDIDKIDGEATIGNREVSGNHNPLNLGRIKKYKALIDNEGYHVKYYYLNLGEGNDIDDTLKKIEDLKNNGTILFLSRKEDFDNETIYELIKDITPIDLIGDIKAIIKYSCIVNKLNLYKGHAVWQHQILNDQASSLIVIDDSYNILYANEKKRSRYKNNILGKKCYQACNADCKIDNNDCPFKGILNNSNIESYERHELKVKDKAGNEYWVSEKYIKTNFGSDYDLGIISAKDINFRKNIHDLEMRSQECLTLEDLFNLIKLIFIETLGFERIRFYENFKENYEPPQLVLLNTFGDNETDIGLIIDSDHITTNNVFKENSKKKYIENLEENHLKVLDINEINPGHKIYITLEKQLKLKKWIDIPLKINGELLGLLCLDFGTNEKRWMHINNDNLSFLKQGSFFIANRLRNIREDKIKTNLSKFSDNLRKNSFNGNKINDICKILSSLIPAHTVLIYEKKNVTRSKNKGNGDESEFYKLNGCSFFDIGDYDDFEFDANDKNVFLSRINKKYHINKDGFNNYKDLSLLSKKLRFSFKYNPINIPIETKGLHLAVMQIISNEDVPISDKEYNYYKRIGEHLSQDLYNKYLKEEHNSIISYITDSLTETGNLQDFLSTLSNKILSLYPKEVLQILLIEEDYLKEKLTLQKEKEYQKNKEPIEYKLPPINLSKIDKISWLKEKKTGLTPTFLYEEETPLILNEKDFENKIQNFHESNETKQRSKYPYLKECKSLIICKIEFQNETIGLLKFYSFLEDAFNDESKHFTNIIAKLIGTVIGLLQEIENRKKYESSMVHALKTPISNVHRLMEMVPLVFKIRIRDFFKLEENSDSININKYSFYQTMLNLKNGADIVNFFIDKPDALNFDKYNFNNNIDLKKLINDLGYLMKSQLEDQKPGAKIYWTKVESFPLIKGDERKLRMALYNLFDNAKKYTLKVLDQSNNKLSYKNITIETHYPVLDGNEPNYKKAILRITNYGETVELAEIENIFTREERGSNAKKWNIDGTGEGLFVSKKVLNYHGASINMIPDISKNKTVVNVEFDLEENKQIEIK